MEPSWEDIVDHARGLATPEQAARVEQDPEAADASHRLAAVAKSAEDQAPEMWVLRAKALLVAETRTIPLLFGRLLPSPLRPSAGFRSGGQATVRRYDFDGVGLDLQTSPGSEPDSIRLTGVLDIPSPAQVRVGTGEDWLDSCDEDGQFSVQVPRPTQTLRFHDLAAGRILQISLDHED
ncbi:MAG: hypothetical protein MH204_03325 [Fimbriimonadaceae bacterium]|nr:hypothetical protein [Fimbriimonadaceae bacterium]